MTTITRKDFLHRTAAVVAVGAVTGLCAGKQGTSGSTRFDVPADELARLAKIEGFRFVLMNEERREIPTGNGYTQGGIVASMERAYIGEMDGKLFVRWPEICVTPTGTLPIDGKPISGVGLVGNGYLLALWTTDGYGMVASDDQVLHFDNLTLTTLPESI